LVILFVMKMENLFSWFDSIMSSSEPEALCYIETSTWWRNKLEN
jgi:hypothetical protein